MFSYIIISDFGIYDFSRRQFCQIIVNTKNVYWLIKGFVIQILMRNRARCLKGETGWTPSSFLIFPTYCLWYLTQWLKRGGKEIRKRRRKWSSIVLTLWMRQMKSFLPWNTFLGVAGDPPLEELMAPPGYDLFSALYDLHRPSWVTLLPSCYRPSQGWGSMYFYFETNKLIVSPHASVSPQSSNW